MTYELAKVWFSSAASADIFFQEHAAELKMSSPTPYLKWRMCLSHFPISMNLIWGANKTSALEIHAQNCTVTQFWLQSPKVFNACLSYFIKFHNHCSSNRDKLLSMLLCCLLKHNTPLTPQTRVKQGYI